MEPKYPPDIGHAVAIAVLRTGIVQLTEIARRTEPTTDRTFRIIIKILRNLKEGQ